MRIVFVVGVGVGVGVCGGVCGGEGELVRTDKGKIVRGVELLLIWDEGQK